MHFTVLILLPSVLALPTALVSRGARTTTPAPSDIVAREEGSGCTAPATCEGNTWSMCSNGAMVSMGELAAGTTCEGLLASFNPTKGANTVIERDGSTCPAPATCEGNSWSMCSNGAMVAMGELAPGTDCTVLLAGFNPLQKRSIPTPSVPLASAKRQEANTCPAPATCEGNSWSMCSSGAMVAMGELAAGTDCTVLLAGFNPTQKRDCPAPASCEGNTWKMCSNGEMVPMGELAAGTDCAILMAGFGGGS